MTDEPGSRGPYLTQQRYLELEKKIAAAEARLTVRIDQIERRLNAVGADVWSGVRAQAKALIDLLQDRAGRT